MPKLLDREQILENNPEVDPERIEETAELFRRLQNQGVVRKRYELEPPFGGPRPTVQDASEADPRTIKLRGWRSRDDSR